jgi:AraC-like DNA-binding protein
LHRSLKRKLVIGLTALAVVAFAGGAYAATQTSASNPRQAFLDDVAKRLHVTPQQLSSALSGAFDDQLQAAVKSGRLTQSQANALEQRLKQNGAAPAIPFGPFGPHPARPGLHRGLGPAGPGVPGDPGVLGGRGVPGGPGVPAGPAGGPVGPMAGAAKYLGLSDPQLLQQLAGGKSLAQIAASRGKTVGGLEAAMTATMKSRLDKLVANKLITSAREQKILSRFSARVSQLVNQKGLPFAHPGLRFRRGVLPNPPAQPKQVVPPVPGAATPVPGAAAPVPVPAPAA